MIPRQIKVMGYGIRMRKVNRKGENASGRGREKGVGGQGYSKRVCCWRVTLWENDEWLRRKRER